MPIHLVCECGARVIAPVKRAGESIRCPKCDGRIAVPAGEGQSSSSPPISARPSRVESAISDLVTARKTDSPLIDARQIDAAAPREARIDLPQETVKPAAPVLATSAPVIAPVLVSASASASSRPHLAAEPSLALPKVELGPAIHRRGVAPMLTVPVDSPHDETVDGATETEAALPHVDTAKPVHLFGASRHYHGDKSWVGAAYGLALLWAALAFIGFGVAVGECWAHYRAEELFRMQRWSFLVIGVSVVQFAFAVYLMRIPNWVACRAAAIVISCIAAGESMILAVTLFNRRDGAFARFLELTPHMQSNHALGVTLLLTVLTLMLAYTTTSISLAWQRYEQRGLFRQAN